MSTERQEIPVVSDTDIDEVERCLGVCFDAARREILRANETFDVQAAPGSGKTTVLVAKLAILAKKWPNARRGICVLSHTNVAREEVGSKLAGTLAGQRLLEYPHYIGTIHGFINEFLALPYLRSGGHPVRLIDDEISGSFCKRLLLSECTTYKTAYGWLSKKRDFDAWIRGLHLEAVGSELELRSAGGALPGTNTPTYQQLLAIKRRAVRAGLWRHDDLLAMARKFLAIYPNAAEIVRSRFPIVFIDEMQDTSERQNAVISQIFPSGSNTIRQRFGDSNQAIYDFGEPATSDPFPSGPIKNIPNSKRFGPFIAEVAKPLAVRPPEPALSGDGPHERPEFVAIGAGAMQNTVFIFEQDSAQEVLPAFARLVLTTFPDSVIRSESFVARAIGRVGKDNPEAGAETRPRSLGDYWPGFEPSVQSERRPRLLSEYFHLAQRKRSLTDDCSEAVQLVATGLCELVDRVDTKVIRHKARGVSLLRTALENDRDASRRLHELMWNACVLLQPVTEYEWANLQTAIRAVLAPIIGDRWTPAAEEFVQWSGSFLGEHAGIGDFAPARPNRFSYSHEGRELEIEVGTIHGAKGQTHTATLVLETAYKKVRDVSAILPSLVGHGQRPSLKKEEMDRRRLLFTAMTRPSHMLCIALRSDALGRSGDPGSNIDALQNAGWHVVMLGSQHGRISALGPEVTVQLEGGSQRPRNDHLHSLDAAR